MRKKRSQREEGLALKCAPYLDTEKESVVL